MKPFLKWAGSKYRIINRLKSTLPSGKRLIEPFGGSGAVFLNTDYDHYVVADLNKDLIDLFLQIQNDSVEFINFAEKLFILENNTEEMFYKLRSEFNTSTDIKRKSGLFVYLNRHCFNGLCRYNSKGFFNVPFGMYSHPKFPKKEIEFFAEKSKNVSFRNCDFEETMKSAQYGDVVYCDPPYAPLSNKSNFSDYTREGFSLKSQQNLCELAMQLKNKGINVVISNHDTVFTRELYTSADIYSFEVQRFISSDTTNRKKAAELLAFFI